MNKLTIIMLFTLFMLVLISNQNIIFASINVVNNSGNNNLKPLSKPLINDLRINDDIGSADQKQPAIAMNKFGYAVVCWKDNRDGNPRIYVQLFGNKGFTFKPNIQVLEWPGSIQQEDPDVAMNDRGHFVVVWEDDQTGDFDIYAQLFAANGNTIGHYFRVNDDMTTEAQHDPAIAMDGNGNFVICWTDNRNSRVDIYAQRYDFEGTPLGSNFMVNDVAPYPRGSSDVDMNETGTFVIVWQDGRNYLVNYIYARRYNSDGIPQGDVFQANLDPLGEKEHFRPSVAVQDDGKFMICYNIQGLVQVLYGNLYDSDGTSLIDYFQIPETGTTSNNGASSVSSHPNGGFSVIWHSDRDGTYDIYGRNFNNAGSPLGPSVRVNDVSGDQKYPCLAVDDRGLGFMAWEDDRNTNWDIYRFWLGPLSPLNPTAGTGFNSIVPLSWDHLYGFADIDIYNIYRSTTPGGPYSPLVTVDLSLRGPLGRQMRDWIDADVTNGDTYYYKIAAMVYGVESQRSIEVSATPASEGYQIQSSWATTSPTIDGQITTGEWDEATAVDISSPQAPTPLMLYVKNNADYLYLALDDPNDKVIDSGNLWAIIFDEDNNNMWDATGPSNEGLITISNAAVFFTGYWGTYPNSLGADVPGPATGITKAISTVSGNVQYEASFDLTISPLNAGPGQTIGVAFMLDDPSNFYGYHYGYAAEWPPGSLWEAAMPLGDLTLDAYTKGTQPISITHGKLNMISFNIEPPDLAVEIMLDDLETLLVAQDDDGKFYIPPYGVNTISNVDLSNGYQVYVTGTVDDTVMNEGGPLVPQDYSQALNNSKLFMIGYPYQNPHPVTEVFATISSAVVVVQDDAGRFWIPRYGVNTMGNMLPGKGYQIYVDQTVNFTYPALAGGLAKATEVVAELPEPSHFQFQRTGLPYGIVVTGSEKELAVGDEVGVFAGELCVGASVFTGQYPLVIAAWEGNEEYGLTGFKAGEHITLRVWKVSENKEMEVVDRFSTSDESIFRAKPISVVHLDAFISPVAIPTAFGLDQNYPNPFNLVTIIKYQLPQGVKVTLQIYDVLGRLVRTLVNTEQLAGYYEVSWDGKDDRGQLLPSGFYFYQIQAGEFQGIKRLLLIK